MQPSEIVSLWEMLRVYAERFMHIARELTDARVGIYYLPDIGDDSHRRLPDITDEHKEHLRALFGSLAEYCQELGLRGSRDAFLRAGSDLPQTEREFSQVQRVFEDELSSIVFLALSGSRARFYMKESFLSDPTKAAFPTVYEELLNARKAYGLGLDTACVFHCMRALEPVLRVLAAEVGESVGVDNWHNVIDRIEAKIRAEGKALPKGSPKNERLQFLSESATQFVYFKDGWRNHVSHGRDTYDQERARRVMEHVQAFVEQLAKQLHE